MVSASHNHQSPSTCSISPLPFLHPALVNFTNLGEHSTQIRSKPIWPFHSSKFSLPFLPTWFQQISSFCPPLILLFFLYWRNVSCLKYLMRCKMVTSSCWRKCNIHCSICQPKAESDIVVWEERFSLPFGAAPKTYSHKTYGIAWCCKLHCLPVAFQSQLSVSYSQ